jgi:hypothetical protein
MKINFKLFFVVFIFTILIPVSIVYAAAGTVRIYFPVGTTNPVGAQVTVFGTVGGSNIQAPTISTTLYPPTVTPPSATISTNPTSCTENCNATVSWTSSNVENIVRIYRNGVFWINAASSTPGSATDWTLPAGTYEYCIRAVNNSWVESANLACATTTVSAQPQNITVSITATPQSMTLPTNSTTLNWSTTGSPASCTASGSWGGVKSESGGSQNIISLTAGTYTYIITCSKSGVPDATASVTVNVNQASTIGVSITATPQSMTLPTNSTTLNWSTTGNPTSCTLTRGGTVLYTGTNTSFTNSGLTAGSYTYTITCSKSGVPNATASVTVNVNSSTGPSNVDLKVTVWEDGSGGTVPFSGQLNIDGPAWAFEGALIRLSWGAVSNAVSCNINGGSVNVSGGSQNNIHLTHIEGFYSRNYTLTCTSSNGQTSSDTVTVNIPPPPTNGFGSCSGTAASFSWTAPSGYTNFYTRATNDTNNTTAVWNNNFVGTQENFTGSPNNNYSWWVHTRHIGTGAWSYPTGGQFPCQGSHCDGTTWYNIPGAGTTLGQPVGVFVASNKNVQTALKDSVNVIVRGSDNRVYYRICNFNGTNECTWNADWQNPPGNQLTYLSPVSYVGDAWDILVKGTDNLTNRHTINWGSGWQAWYNDGQSNLNFGHPFRFTDKIGRVWQLRRNSDGTISYLCGATACVTLSFNSANSSFSPSTVNVNDDVTVYCDYNVVADAIGVTSAGFQSCEWQSFNGTQAIFNCKVGATSGSHNVYCQNFTGTAHNICSQSNLIGTLNVNDPTAPVNVSVSANPSTLTLPSNSTTISWSTTGSPTSCTASGSWSGSKNTSGGSEPISGLAEGVHTFTLTCSKSGVNDGVGQVLVSVNAGTPTYSLTVIKSGQGMVTSAPAGIDCGSACTNSYEQGTTVVLTATPNTGRIFTGWSGGGCTGRGTCTTTVNGNTTIIANFAIDPNYKEF